MEDKLITITVILAAVGLSILAVNENQISTAIVGSSLFICATLLILSDNLKLLLQKDQK